MGKLLVMASLSTKTESTTKQSVNVGYRQERPKEATAKEGPVQSKAVDGGNRKGDPRLEGTNYGNKGNDEGG